MMTSMMTMLTMMTPMTMMIMRMGKLVPRWQVVAESVRRSLSDYVPALKA